MGGDNISKFIRNRLIQEFLFWVVSFLILLNLFTRTYQTRVIDYIYAFLFHLPLLVAVSGNTYFLIPKFLSNGKFGLYLTLHIPLFGLVYASYYFTFNILADWIFLDYYFITDFTYVDILIFYVVYIGLTTLMELSKSWFQELEIKKKMEALKKEKIETELKVLREQINPHFLFNSLNHIYSLATQKSPDTPQTILQLSDLLRYTLKQSGNEVAFLEDEINYISKYINLYKDRIHHPERVKFMTKGDFKGWTIAPLLLIIFIENCFKHGTTEQPGELICIKIINANGKLRLITSNSIDEIREIPQQIGGLGLENVKRRLELRYPDRHRLDIITDNHKFEVALIMELE